MTVLAVSTHGNVYLMAAAFANSATFQGVVGAGDETQALEHIHYPDVHFEDDEDGKPAMYCDLMPPRIVIPYELGDHELGDGVVAPFRVAESFTCIFDFVAPDDIAAEGRKNSFGWFHDKVWNILKEIRDLGRTGQVTGTSVAYPAIRATRVIEGPYLMDIAEQSIRAEDSPEAGVPQHVWHTSYEIEWG